MQTQAASELGCSRLPVRHGSKFGILPSAFPIAGPQFRRLAHLRTCRNATEAQMCALLQQARVRNSRRRENGR